VTRRVVFDLSLEGMVHLGVGGEEYLTVRFADFCGLLAAHRHENARQEAFLKADLPNKAVAHIR
jgi:hypothetical protein